MWPHTSLLLVAIFALLFHCSTSLFHFIIVSNECSKVHCSTLFPMIVLVLFLEVPVFSVSFIVNASNILQFVCVLHSELHSVIVFHTSYIRTSFWSHFVIVSPKFLWFCFWKKVSRFLWNILLFICSYLSQFKLLFGIFLLFTSLSWSCICQPASKSKYCDWN